MHFNLDRLAVTLLTGGALLLAGWRWLADHPQHNPWAPLLLKEPQGWATHAKLARLRDRPEECRAFLRRSHIAFTNLPPAGEDQCRRADRMVLALDDLDLALKPAAPQASCAVEAGLVYWLHHEVQPAARDMLGSRVTGLEHYGTHSCRRIGGGTAGRWSQHATGNAIDIAAVRLADGRRLAIAHDWAGESEEARFLRRIRTGACISFATVLSPEYNAAHADHLHFDQAPRRIGGTVCR